MRSACAVAILCLLLVAGAQAQSTSSVEDFGTAPAALVKKGLGFNVEPGNEWEFQLASQIGSSYVRFDCGWQSTEKQMPGNTSGGFTLPTQCAAGLAFARKYGQRPSINAAYGPPSRTVVAAEIAEDTPPGSYVLRLAHAKGDLQSLQAGTNEIFLADHGQQITKRHSYPGSLILAVHPNEMQVELASATSVLLAKGTAVLIHQLLYPPVLLKTSENFLTNPSIVAFGRYAHFLAQSIQQAGVSGEVGLWNEPNWPGDPWDNGRLLYDNPPPGLVQQPSIRVEIPIYMSTTEPVRGVVYDSGYTEKTGNGSMYTPQNLHKIPSIPAVRSMVAFESFHPYGNSPEDHFWYPSCLKGLRNDPQAGGLVMPRCSAVGANAGSNFKLAVFYAMTPEAQGGSHFNITETGLCRECLPGTSEEQVTRFTLRQFIGYIGLGVSPIMFYRLADRDKNNFGWVDYHTRNPLPVFVAMSALMKDVMAVGEPPSEGANCALPHVTTYQGPYPLATVSFVGTCPAKEGEDEVLYFTWQRSYPADRKDPWTGLPSPPAVPVVVSIPRGMQVATVKDTVTTKSVSYDAREGTISYLVADNPVEVVLRARTGHHPSPP